MADRLAIAMDRLNTVRKAHMATSVTYTRGANSVTLSATLGATTYETADEAGVLVQSKGTDFIVSAADLVLNSVLELPEIGDQIRIAQGGVTQVFQVLPVGDAGHYRLVDPHGRMLRIHAKQVGEE